jgi:hypothetical protein
MVVGWKIGWKDKLRRKVEVEAKEGRKQISGPRKEKVIIFRPREEFSPLNILLIN